MQVKDTGNKYTILFTRSQRKFESPKYKPSKLVNWLVLENLLCIYFFTTWTEGKPSLKHTSTIEQLTSCTMFLRTLRTTKTLNYHTRQFFNSLAALVLKISSSKIDHFCPSDKTIFSKVFFGGYTTGRGLYRPRKCPREIKSSRTSYPMQKFLLFLGLVLSESYLYYQRVWTRWSMVSAFFSNWSLILSSFRHWSLFRPVPSPGTKVLWSLVPRKIMQWSQVQVPSAKS